MPGLQPGAAPQSWSEGTDEFPRANRRRPHAKYPREGLSLVDPYGCNRDLAASPKKRPVVRRAWRKDT
jgi:hypothetical protein